MRQIEVIRAWIDSAQDDRAALDLLELEGPPRVVAFHAQQAVEKLLKALLISYGVEPEDSHVIGNLLGQLHRLDRETATTLGPVDRLTPYAVLMRYPPRVGRAPRSLDRTRILTDVAAARNACTVLDSALASRLATLSARAAAAASEPTEPPTQS